MLNITNRLKENDESHSITEKALNSILTPALVFNEGSKDLVPKKEAEYISKNKFGG